VGAGLTGEMISFSESTSLTTLMLGGNSLTGTIPEDLLASVDSDAPVTADLTGSRLTGRVPAALSRIQSMNLYLVGNGITEIDSDLCYMENWMNGLVQEFSCDAILFMSDTSGGRREYRDDGRRAICPPTTAGDATTPAVSTDKIYGRVHCGDGENDVDFDPTPESLQSAQRAALESLYDGSHWRNRHHWMSSSKSVCTWFGMTCDDSSAITSISLGDNLLRGTVPTSKLFDSLPKLEKMYLYSS
jgi:hypothetical protein